MTPIEYLELRVATLQSEKPQTRAGAEALAHTVHELNNCIWALKLEAVIQLQKAIQEAAVTE